MDTGPLVALLDSSERRHRDCAKFFSTWKGRVFTSEAVVTEAAYLLASAGVDGSAVLRFCLQGGATVKPWTDARTRRAADLMVTYADIPMDYADGTLVALAEELGIADVFTLDRKGFGAYRWSRKRTFRIVPN
jgi:predicted nucleic acid-binding protein